MIDKILEKSDKILKYIPYSMDDLKLYAIIGIAFLILIFLYFEFSWSITKDNIVKWDSNSFLKLTILMLIPLASIFGLTCEIVPNERLNNWIHFFLLFFIIPIIPYICMIIYRLIYWMVKSIVLAIYHAMKKTKSKNNKKNDNDVLKSKT